jgi:hypothetical protein
MATTDKIVFGDLRDREAAEKKKINSRFQVLTNQIPKKRALTPDEELELKEIEAKRRLMNPKPQKNPASS